MNILYFILIINFLDISLGSPYQNKHEIFDDQDNDNEMVMIPLVNGSFRIDTYGNIKREYFGSIPYSLTSEEPTKNTPIKFYLYTNANKNNGEIIIPNNLTSLKLSSFNSKYPTRIITHGWRNRLTSKVNLIIRDAYLTEGNYNVFVVDWSAAADTYNYVSARYSVQSVGIQIAQFLDFLNEYGEMSFKTLTAIGHSLGAHCTGIAGKNLKRGKINIIIGLDPAWPLFFYNKPVDRLSVNDAQYVETIQTCGAVLGFLEPIGIASFYPNWGKKQPGCGYDFNGKCSHQRAYHYFAEAIKNNNFKPLKCNGYTELLKRNCTIKVDNIKMGDESNNGKNAQGIYFLPTNPEEPFAVSDA